jgi:GT2 family glycosyltransferase
VRGESRAILSEVHAALPLLYGVVLMQISVIVPTFRRIQSLLRCLQSLSAQSYCSEDFEVIVVDDAQTEEARAAAEAQSGLRIRYVKGAGSGPAAARNRGAGYAQGDVLAFIDDDCVADRRWLEKIGEVFSAYPDTAACGGEIVNVIESGVFRGVDYQSADIIRTLYGASRFLKYEFTPLRLPGTENFAVRRGVFEESGGFNEKFSWAGENPDYIYRLLKSGRRVYVKEGMRVIHYARSTLKSIARGMFRYGIADAINIKEHFRNWLVLDLHIASVFHRPSFYYFRRFPVTCCIRIDLCKVCLAAFILALFNPALFLLLGLVCIIFGAAKIRHPVRLLMFWFYVLYRQFWYAAGHIVGSLRHGVVYV